MSEDRIGRREFVELAAGSCGIVVLSETIVLPEFSMAPAEQIGTASSKSAAANSAPVGSLADVHRGVASVLASQRVGTPVFVRYTWHGSEQGNGVISRLAQFAAAVTAWMGRPIVSVYAIGKVDAEQVSLTLQFAGGASVLITFARGATAAVDFMLVGNHGSISHDAGAARIWNQPLTCDLPAADPATTQLIEQALASSQPVKTKTGAAS